MKAVQSAMAIRRQRNRRDEAVRAKTRRTSHQSDHLMLSDIVGSQLSLNGHSKPSRSVRQRQVVGGVTTFHVGVVLGFTGLLCLISGIQQLVPGYSQQQYTFAKASVENEKDVHKRGYLLLGTGCILLLSGIGLIIANRIASKKEDERFSRYIRHKLAPAKIPPQSLSAYALGQARKFSNKEEMLIQSGHDSGRYASANEDMAVQGQSSGHLESIIEEVEGPSERASKDQLYWSSEVAPVHQFQGQKSHSRHDFESSDEPEDRQRQLDDLD